MHGKMVSKQCIMNGKLGDMGRVGGRYAIYKLEAGWRGRGWRGGVGAGVMILSQSKKKKGQKEHCDLKGLYLYRDFEMWSGSQKYSKNYPVL